MRPSAPPEATISIDATLDDVRQLTECVRAFAEAHESEEATLIDIELAVAEAANNIVIHGYKHGPGRITLRLMHGGDGIWIELLDSGAPIPAALLGGPSSAEHGAESGRGLTIILACVDELAYESANGENRLRLLKRRP